MVRTVVSPMVAEGLDLPMAGETKMVETRKMRFANQLMKQQLAIDVVIVESALSLLLCISSNSWKSVMHVIKSNRCHVLSANMKTLPIYFMRA